MSDIITMVNVNLGAIAVYIQNSGHKTSPFYCRTSQSVFWTGILVNNFVLLIIWSFLVTMRPREFGHNFLHLLYSWSLFLSVNHFYIGQALHMNNSYTYKQNNDINCEHTYLLGTLEHTLNWSPSDPTHALITHIETHDTQFY